ncbi:hypothetical protein BLL38_01580 [Pseudomonas gessardii]|nr:hypothetical protein BLL38_01580 [Pseudomonas gessardii]
MLGQDDQPQNSLVQILCPDLIRSNGKAIIAHIELIGIAWTETGPAWKIYRHPGHRMANTQPTCGSRQRDHLVADEGGEQFVCITRLSGGRVMRQAR